MQTRNLIIRLNSDERRQAIAWLASQEGQSKSPIVATLRRALETVRDGGALEGTPYEDVPIRETSAPITSGEEPKAPEEPKAKPRKEEGATP